ncbi:hypothetical protein QBC42DRAFT_343154 [Cladorrhinum samala]|uniref:Copper acquisition factor BIM1-like domain-containing protein n=1 Tax=Cladorrhinum samala TaxID=585594 RepID=A0AAV9I1Z6_9PEZI|nr:hypothetical protein QBC42DRAFT_343154 [Cladorrhinum samala]
MPSRSSSLLAACLYLANLTAGHTVVTYPLWRGNTLIANDTFPRGMQWTYPCGGIEPTTNRTYWPLGESGGAVALQPGWFRGHEQGLIYINIGVGENPENYSFPLTVFHFTGVPGNNPYPGTICLPFVRLSEEVRRLGLKEGDKASLQVVEASAHGAAQYNCADIIFTEDMRLVPQVNETNCFNSTNIHMNEVNFPAPVPTSASASASASAFASMSSTTTLATADVTNSESVGTGSSARARGEPVVGMWASLLTIVAGRYLA